MVLTVFLFWLAFDVLKGHDESWVAGALGGISMGFLVHKAAMADEEGL